MSDSTVHRIVLTGGPCAGKTTALSHISERLQSLGVKVFVVPEAATILIGGGVGFRDIPPDQQIGLQGHLIGVQMALEDIFVQIARASASPAVVICDRGAMDTLGYLSETGWQALLDEHGWTVIGLRDRRYDAVIHMVTAADGAEEFYSTTNNTARSETPELARAIDTRLRDAWSGHPHLRVIDNRGPFQEKIRRVVQAVCQVVGAPVPVEIERKFLVTRVPDKFPVRSEEVEIEQTYLLAPDNHEARVRRRGQDGSYTYTHTIKTPALDGGRVESERQISPREYVVLLLQADPTRRTIRKRRRCFLWENQYFELDIYDDPRPGMIILEAELEHLGQEVALPPFIEIERDVTGVLEFSNHAIARS
jgi:CYTH domain-containing protein/predicted ATPase